MSTEWHFSGARFCASRDGRYVFMEAYSGHTFEDGRSIVAASLDNLLCLGMTTFERERLGL